MSVDAAPEVVQASEPLDVPDVYEWQAPNSDEQSNPVAETASEDAGEWTPEVEEDQPGEAVDADEGAEGEGADPSEDDGDVEWATVEIDGKTYHVHPDLKDGVMRHADYTQKTQQAAEMRRQLEQHAEQLQRQQQEIQAKQAHVAKLSEQDIQIQVQLHQVDAQLAAIEARGAEINAMRGVDDITYAAEVSHYNALKTQKAELERAKSDRETQATAAQRQEVAKRQTQTWQWAEKAIPNWGAEKWGQMQEVAKSVGINPQTLAEGVNPSILQILDLALAGKKLTTATATPPKVKPKLPPNFKPTPGLAARNNPKPRPSLNTSNMDEYLAALKAQG